MTTVAVATVAELESALDMAQPNDLIEVQAGSYTVKQTLVVPRGVSVEGAGKMPGNTEQTATGFAQGSAQSILIADPDLTGDILRLGDGTRIVGLTIKDVERHVIDEGKDSQTEQAEKRDKKGNLVAVYSTKVNDKVHAAIDGCQLENPNASSLASWGPTCRAVVVTSRQIPAPHEGSNLSVSIARTVVTAPGNGSAVFAINFAARARIILRLSRNRLGGNLDCNGGVSRPVRVSGSETLIFSDRNLFHTNDEDPGVVGWQLTGGSNPPIDEDVPGTNGNLLVMRSHLDEISGFYVAVSAAGGRRPRPLKGRTDGQVDFNHAHLELSQLKVASLEVDFELFGASSGHPAEPPGNDNRLRVSFENVRGSGSPTLPTALWDLEWRDNKYMHAVSAAGLLGAGNCLEIFNPPGRSGPKLEPAPPSNFYCGRWDHFDGA
jgi:hypothetical protein